MDHKVHHPVAVAKFIVIPGNEIDRVMTEINPSPSIEGGGVDLTVKVAEDNLVLSIFRMCSSRGPLMPASLRLGVIILGMSDPQLTHCGWGHGRPYQLASSLTAF